MKNFVVERILGGVAEMNPHLVGGGTDAPVQNGSILFLISVLNRSYCVPSFLAVGRNPWYDVDGCSRQTESQPSAA